MDTIVVSLIVNLTQPRTTWGESSTKGLLSLHFPVGLSMKSSLTKLADVGGPSPRRVAPFPRQSVLSCIRWINQAEYKKAIECACIDSPSSLEQDQLP